MLVSSALRTRQTWAALAEGAGVGDLEPCFDDALFTGSADVALETLQATPEGARTVLFVGHNPTAAYLCHYLDDGEGRPRRGLRPAPGLPARALAVLEMSVPWADLGAETGRVVAFHVGG